MVPLEPRRDARTRRGRLRRQHVGHGLGNVALELRGVEQQSGRRDSLSRRSRDLRAGGACETTRDLLLSSRASGETFEHAKRARPPHSPGGACTHVHTVDFTCVSAISPAYTCAHSSSFRYSYGYSRKEKRPACSRRLSHPEALAVGYAQHLPTRATEVNEPLSHDASKLLVPHSP